MFWFRGSLVDGMRVCFLVSGTPSCWKESSSVIDVQRCGAVDRDRCGLNASIIIFGASFEARYVTQREFQLRFGNFFLT